MKILLRRFGSRTAETLGLDRLGKAYHILSLNFIFFVFHSSFESVFINTLLFRVSDGNMRVVIVYRGLVFILISVIFHLGAYVAQKKSPMAAVRIGVFFYLLMYLTLFIWMEHVESLQYLIAFLFASGAAFYWSGHTMLIPHYTTKSNRDVGMALLGIINGTMVLIVPMISGFLITLMPEISGYRVMFGASMLAALMQLYYLTKFHPVKQQINKSQMKLALRLLKRKITYKLVLAYEFIRGMRDGTFMFMLNMLLFEIIRNEGIVGINTFFTGLLAIVGSWTYGKLVGPGQRAKYTLISMGVPFVMGIILLWWTNVATVMIFTAINAFMQLFWMNSISNTTFDVISQNRTTIKASAETFAIRETALAAGRILGLALTMYFSQFGLRGYVLALLTLTAIQLPGIWLMHKTLYYLGRKEHRMSKLHENTA